MMPRGSPRTRVSTECCGLAALIDSAVVGLSWNHSICYIYAPHCFLYHRLSWEFSFNSYELHMARPQGHIDRNLSGAKLDHHFQNCCSSHLGIFQTSAFSWNFTHVVFFADTRSPHYSSEVIFYLRRECGFLICLCLPAFFLSFLSVWVQHFEHHQRRLSAPHHHRYLGVHLFHQFSAAWRSKNPHPCDYFTFGAIICGVLWGTDGWSW